MLITPRKPWSFFLNFFWSKICTVNTLESLTFTSNDSFQSAQLQSQLPGVREMPGHWSAQGLSVFCAEEDKVSTGREARRSG